MGDEWGYFTYTCIFFFFLSHWLYRGLARKVETVLYFIFLLLLSPSVFVLG